MTWNDTVNENDLEEMKPVVIKATENRIEIALKGKVGCYFFWKTSGMYSPKINFLNSHTPVGTKAYRSIIEFLDNEVFKGTDFSHIKARLYQIKSPKRVKSSGNFPPSKSGVDFSDDGPDEWEELYGPEEGNPSDYGSN